MNLGETWVTWVRHLGNLGTWATWAARTCRSDTPFDFAGQALSDAFDLPCGADEPCVESNRASPAKSCIRSNLGHGFSHADQPSAPYP